jgi:RNA polymerase sigma-70 factor (ECF subfamily)
MAENANEPERAQPHAPEPGAASEYFLQVWRAIGPSSSAHGIRCNALSWANIRHIFGAKLGIGALHPDRAAAPLDRDHGRADRIQGESERLIVANREPSVTEHIPGLRRYARALVGDPAEADDLVQECLTRALARRHALGRIDDLRAYLFTILHNVHVDRRTQHRRRGGSVPLDHVQARLASQPNQLRRIELHDLASALARLPVEQRDVVLLIGVEGMSYRETAGVLDIPIGTVMSRLSRGREALRQSIAGERAPPLRKAASL